MAASTSTSISPSAIAYDVFINHGVADVKMTFPSDLYRRLFSHGHTVFLDNQEVNRGEKLDPEINEAIASASVHVAIFSRTYAQSNLYLDELKLMLQSNSTFIPVFYDGVTPADLRWTNKGVYGEAVDILEKEKADDGQPRYNSATVKEWRSALSGAADITGFDLKTFDNDEGELLDKVVKGVRKLIKKPQLEVATHATGLEDKVQDFKTKVSWQPGSGRVQVVLIAGQGGVGKTTLAKELFNRRSVDYKKYYFLLDVRENARKSLTSLQAKLLKGLNLFDGDIDSVSQGQIKLKQYLKGSQVLIVLDDIDKVDQVHELLPLDDLHPNSFILITSRDKNVLASLGKEKSSIYELTGLNDHHSRELFCSYAFCQPLPPLKFESLVDRFLKACQGLPLSLKVLGTLVSGNTEQSESEDQLTKLRQTLPDQIQERLKISYYPLDKQEKQIFQDIACFLIGEDRDTAIHIWKGSGWLGSSVGFRKLHSKCLVELDTENKIRMHDHLRDMGRDLAAKDPEWPRRLWRGVDDLKHHSSGTTDVRGMRVFLSQTDMYSFHRMVEKTNIYSFLEGIRHKNEWADDTDLYYGSRYSWRKEDADSWHKLRKLSQLNGVKVTNLQLLDVNFLSQQFLSGVESPNLIWLRWHNCPFSYLPSWIPMKDLRVLEVQGGALIELWRENMVPSELRELRIFAPLQNIPESIGNLKHLESLQLDLADRYGERSLFAENNLKELNIRELRLLKELVIQNSKLESIRGFAGLTMLRTLRLHGNHLLEELPDFEKLSSLKQFDVSRCLKLKGIRGSADLTKLSSVNVSSCPKLKELLGFENLRSLEELQVHTCGSVKSIRGSAELTKLRKVNIIRCFNLEELPGFENLRSLEEFNVSDCRKLKSISWGSAELTKLRKVDVRFCDDLEELPGFENSKSLEELQVHDCRKLKSIQGSAELTKLRKVYISNCSNLKEKGFENLRSMEGFVVSNCWSFWHS